MLDERATLGNVARFLLYLQTILILAALFGSKWARLCQDWPRLFYLKTQINALQSQNVTLTNKTYYQQKITA